MESAFIYVMAELLSCGYADLTFFEEEANKFNQEYIFDTIADKIKETDGYLTLNDLLHEVYTEAVNDAYNELELNLNDNINYDIYTNCLDSHLYLKDADGENIESINDMEELKEYLIKHYLGGEEEENN